MKNREKILATNLYDMLVEMNNNMRTYASPVNPCIYVALGHKNRLSRCSKYNNECTKCIEEYLNQEAR